MGWTILGVETKSPLYKLRGRKGDFLVHHDTLKLCEVHPIPLWLRRERSSVPDIEEQDTTDLVSQLKNMKNIAMGGDSSYVQESINTKIQKTDNKFITDISKEGKVPHKPLIEDTQKPGTMEDSLGRSSTRLGRNVKKTCKFKDFVLEYIRKIGKI